MKIVADAHIPYIEKYFSAHGELILKPGREIVREDVKEADMLLVRAVTNVNENLLAGSKVKFVGSVTAGADHLDTNWLDNVGIKWSVAEGFNAPPVADYVVSVIAALQRRHLLSTKNVKAAIVGVGNVGRLVADHLKILGIEVMYCDPLRAANEKDFHSVSFDEIADVDLILLHVPLTKDVPHPTYHMIGKEFLLRQKPGCILLNASRGSVMNSQALMLHGTHLQWCLDVFEHEPKIDKSILNRAVIATPHIAGYSVQSRVRGIDMIYRIAGERGFIQPIQQEVVEMPRQTLSFAGSAHHWQDIVLGIFNPLVMATMMCQILLPVDDDGRLFDEMRQQFTYRHEFAFTSLTNVDAPDEDMQVLSKLGIRFVLNA